MSQSLIKDDLSADFNAIATRLKHPSGVAYRDFRKSLTPRFFVVWRDITAGLIGLVVVGVALALVPFPNWYTGLLGALLGAIAFGYLHQYVSLFMHEAAHFNVAPTRRSNDVLTNIFLGVIQGYSIQAYRPKHFAHHRDLGSPEDPEHHYFHALDWHFFVYTLTGRPALSAVLERFFGSKAPDEKKPASATKVPASGWVVAAGGLLHLAIVAGAVWTGKWPLAVAWALGFLVWFPFFSMLRQILEHRDFDAPATADYSRQHHGAITRIFGDGPVANTLGGAGFNRHLLHHWEPQVSYTRLADLERYLAETEAGEIIAARHDTYASAFGKLLK